MYFAFLWEVVKRAFTPTPRLTDGLQVAAASALPAAAKFAGWDWGANAQNDALAYIGLVALFFVGIRLFWAPYALWKEQCGENGALKLELQKPERLELEWIARRRAKARMKLATLIRQYQAASFHDEPDETNKLSRAMVNQHAKVPSANALDSAIARLHEYCSAASELDYNDPAWIEKQSIAMGVAALAQEFLHGKITAEDLALRLPPSTAPEKQP